MALAPYSISKIGTDYLGVLWRGIWVAYIYHCMGTHTGPRRSDVFFESTVAKQIALIEAGHQEPKLKVGNLASVRTFQDARDAVRAYYLLALESEKGMFLSAKHLILQVKKHSNFLRLSTFY
jgi:GDPmannose 4,6-dehydratase